jgi:hypothetical protein
VTTHVLKLFTVFQVSKYSSGPGPEENRCGLGPSPNPNDYRDSPVAGQESLPTVLADLILVIPVLPDASPWPCMLEVLHKCRRILNSTVPAFPTLA